MKKKIILIVAITLVVVAGGILTGLYIIGDKIIDEVIEMSIPTIPAAGDTGITAQNSAAVTTDGSTEQNVSVTAEPSVALSGTDTGSVSNPTGNVAGEASKEVVQAVTVEKMNEIKEDVTAKDKVEAAAMVMSKLTSTEINELTGMLSGGLTEEEKAEAKAIAYSNFSSEEIAKIKEMYKKYMNK